MHGRLKVKTTAEQEEAKRIEREKKVKKYTTVTQKIFEKRKLGENDLEAVELTAQLLSSNPDFYTLWNYRREVFIHWKNTKEDKEDLQEVFENELHFVEQCLRINPKSYGCWQQRCWIIDNMPNPDLKKELMLCNKYLEYDDRNFHCWDYRRFVVQHSKVSPELEFKFTTDMISTNFSNYSSWHYRSKLLPLVHPDSNHPVGVEEETLLQEFELAQNAFFTDPNDQSAWFYHRWLLGRGKRPMHAECVIIDRTYKRCVLVLNGEPEIPELQVSLTVDNNNTSAMFNPIGPSQYSRIWTSDLEETYLQTDKDHLFKLSLKDSECEVQVELCKDQVDAIWRQQYKQGTKFNYELSAATSDILTQELQSCQQLHDLEPDNKWALLTIVLLMRAIDPLRYEAETLQYMTKLEAVDPTRLQYYKDLRSKFIIENALERLPYDSRSLDLSHKNLTTLYHLDQMSHLTHIDLSHNQLSYLPDLYYLQSATTIDIHGNPIVLSEEDRVLNNVTFLN